MDSNFYYHSLLTALKGMEGATGLEPAASFPAVPCGHAVTGQRPRDRTSAFCSVNSSRLSDFSEASVQPRCAQSPKVSKRSCTSKSVRTKGVGPSSSKFQTPNRPPIRRIGRSTARTGVFVELRKRRFWLRGVDLNYRPLGYEPDRSVLNPVDSAVLTHRS